MPQKSYLKVFGYGLLLFVITNLLLLSVSFISQSDQPIDHWWVGTIVAILVAFFSWLFARRLHPTTSKQALTYGTIWAIMLAAIFMIFVKRNDSLNLLFGNWSTYLIFIGVLVGPVLMKPRPLQSGISNTNNQFKN